MSAILRLEHHVWPVPPEHVLDDNKSFQVSRDFREWCRANLRYEWKFQWCAGEKSRLAYWALCLTSDEDYLLVRMTWQ